MVANQRGRNAGYSVDLVFTSEFQAAQSPVQMAWVALAAGAAVRSPAEPFTYCDLGCGDGAGLVVLAECFPHARFVGVDINPEHIALAQALAERAGLKNVSFIEASFENLHAVESGAFDFITLFGIYSWLPVALREAVHDFVRDRLGPTGLFVVQYLSMPGSALSDLIASYIRLLAEPSATTTAERFESGFGELKRVAPLTRVFAGDPLAAAALAEIERIPINLVAHDFMNRQAPAFQFHDVHQSIASLGLDYYGSAWLADNLPELRVPKASVAAYRELVAGKDRAVAESLLDLVTHAHNRVDLYGRAGIGDGPGLRQARGIYLQRTGGSGDLKSRQDIAQRFAVALDSGLHSTLLDLCEQQSLTVPDVLNHTALESFAEQEILQAVMQLAATRMLSLLIAPAAATGYDSSKSYRIASPLNRITFAEQLTSPDPMLLASRILGGSLEVPEGTRIRLQAFLGGDLEEIWRAYRDDKRDAAIASRVPSLPTFRDRVMASLPDFIANELPHLLKFGIVEAVP